MMKIRIVSKPSQSMTGTRRYTEALAAGLASHGHEPEMVAPQMPPFAALTKGMGIDLASFFSSYPISLPKGKADICHIPTQTMATLLNTMRFTCPVIVTVLDIIPFVVRKDPDLRTFAHPIDEIFYRWALHGLKKADALMAISEYTKMQLVEHLHIPPEKILVSHLAVEHDRFRPMPVPDSFRERYGLLDKEARYILYLGSEDPRKNLGQLVDVFAELRKSAKNLHLIKVGAAHFQERREALLRQILRLAIGEAVHIFDDVADSDLAYFYNLADVYVMPSLYEGFGLPVLEAMACGKPAVVANRASLPELVGEKGLRYEPNDNANLLAILERLLSDKVLYAEQQQYSLKQASKFSWSACIEETLRVYALVKEQRS
jgi:glycosyltransferase involved in cell wall biosynthesis